MIVLLKTRTAPNDAYEEEFNRRGMSHEFFPLLEHEFVDVESLRGYLESDEFQSVDASIITSQRAVEAVNGQLHDLSENAKSTLLTKPTFTVGPATSKVLNDAGYVDVLGGSQTGNGDALASFILDYGGMKNCVFFTGVTRRDIIPVKLRAANVELLEKVVYRTKSLEGTSQRFQEFIQSKSPKWFVFFSPASTEPVVQVLQLQERAGFKIAAIGPTTEKYLRNNGLHPDVVASKPDAVHLAAAMFDNT